MKTKSLKVLPSKLAQAILTLKGKPLDISNEYKPFELIYNVNVDKLTISAGRQIGKSVGLGAMLTINSILTPHLSSLFIAPLAQQVARFSSSYLAPFLDSPIVKKHYVDSSSMKNVFEKTLNNGSRITLGYADSDESANRIRGISASHIGLDECQDVAYDAIPVLMETIGASDEPKARFTGTAKTENNTLTVMFKRGNQLEWVVKCPHCGKHTIPIDFDNCMKILNINPEGPGCVHCGGLLDMKTGKWIAGKPMVKDHFSFHMPQIIIPARTGPKKWKDLIEKSKTYSVSKCCNEIFGIPSGIGGRILSISEAMACCNVNKRVWDTKFPRDDRNIYVTVCGVDWSVSGSTKSYTQVSILGYDYNGKCYLLYAQKLDGIDILEQVARVEQLYNQFECSIIGSDRGVGVLQGQMFKSHLGDEKVAMINYVSAKNALRWDKVGLYYAADRTMSIDTMILKAKIGKNRFETPCWDLTSEHWEDWLAVYEEESMSGKRLYRKDPDVCDDSLHSVVFANIAFMVLKGEFITVDETPSAASVFDLSQYM